MFCDAGFGFPGKQKTTIISTMNDVAMTAIGRLYKIYSVLISNGID